MEELIHFLSTLTIKQRDGQYYEDLLTQYNVSKEDVEEKIKKINEGKRNQKKEDKKHDMGYKNDAMGALCAIFNEQSVKCIESIFKNYDNFTDAYNDLKNNTHPKNGRRQKRSVSWVPEGGELAKELDALKIEYTTSPGPSLDGRTKEYKEYAKKLDEEIERQRVERAEALRKMREKAEEIAKKEEEQNERFRREFEETNRRTEEIRRQAEETMKRSAEAMRQSAEARRRSEETMKRSAEARRCTEEATKEQTDEAKIKYTPDLSLLPEAKKFFDNVTSLEELKRLRRKKALELHPDKHGGDSSRFTQMEKYYELLIWAKEKKLF